MSEANYTLTGGGGMMVLRDEWIYRCMDFLLPVWFAFSYCAHNEFYKFFLREMVSYGCEDIYHSVILHQAWSDHAIRGNPDAVAMCTKIRVEHRTNNLYAPSAFEVEPPASVKRGVFNLFGSGMEIFFDPLEREIQFTKDPF
jgi:hypothetical protein